jgi:hypothetical protein
MSATRGNLLVLHICKGVISRQTRRSRVQACEVTANDIAYAIKRHWTRRRVRCRSVSGKARSSVSTPLRMAGERKPATDYDAPVAGLETP